MSTGPALHILGCGRAARAVARRLLADGYLRPGLVANRSLDSARRAVEFIGAGEPVAQLDERIAGGWLMLGLPDGRSEEHTSELQSRFDLVCRLLLEKKNKIKRA